LYNRNLQSYEDHLKALVKDYFGGTIAMEDYMTAMTEIWD
jgi:hypothetical protein